MTSSRGKTNLRKNAVTDALLPMLLLVLLSFTVAAVAAAGTGPSNNNNDKLIIGNASDHFYQITCKNRSECVSANYTNTTAKIPNCTIAVFPLKRCIHTDTGSSVLPINCSTAYDWNKRKRVPALWVRDFPANGDCALGGKYVTEAFLVNLAFRNNDGFFSKNVCHLKRQSHHGDNDEAEQQLLIDLQSKEGQPVFHTFADAEESKEFSLL